MSDELEKLRRELTSAQRALAEAESRLARREADHQSANREAGKPRRQIEQAHQERLSAPHENSFLDALIRRLPGIFFLLDAQSNLLQWNENVEELFDLSPEDISGINALALVHDEDKPLVTRKIQQAFTTGSASVEARLVMAQGLGDFLLTGTRVETPSGPRLIGFGINITERKQVESALTKSRNLLQSVVETAPVRIFWKDGDLHYLGCNTRFARDAGYTSPEELIGKSDWDMGWKDQAELYRADDKAVMASGSPKLDIEEPQTTPDGNTIWLRTSKVPLRDEDNHIIGVLGIYDDITKRKLAEQIARDEKSFTDSLIESLPDLFCVFDEQGNILRWNRKASELFGMSEEEISASNAMTLIHEEDRADAARELQKAVETGSAMLDVRLTLANGTRQYHLTANTIKTKSGLNIIGMGFDITERKQVEADLAEQVEELRRWQEATLGREERILELKHEVNALLGQAGQAPRYPSTESPDPEKA